MKNKNPKLDDDIYDHEKPYKPAIEPDEDNSIKLESFADTRKPGLPKEWK